MGVANPRDAKTTPTDLIGAGSSKVEHRMSGDTQPLVFPPSRTCLWDARSVGDPIEICVDGKCWICVKVSMSVLQLALRASQQTNNKPLDCLLLGTTFISHQGGVVVEVDRFDHGRNIDSCVQPTVILPNDVIIYCTVGADDIPGVMAETKILEMLEMSVNPFNLLYLQLNIITHDINISLSCKCIYPSSCTLTPVSALPIVQTALARNLAGPLSLSILQAAVKWGYLTMEITRKLVLLLHSDPKCLRVPLVGIWISGIAEPQHPMVWACVLHYKHCSNLTERVGENGLCLLYSNTKSCLYQFSNQDNLNYSTAHTKHTLQLSSDSTPLSLVLMPSQTITDTTVPYSKGLGGLERKTVPQPSPLPTLVKDSQLSTVSLMEHPLLLHKPCVSDDNSHHTNSSAHEMTIFPEKQTDSQCTRQQDQHQQLQLQLAELLATHRTPTTEIGTNTGQSLLALSTTIVPEEGTNKVSIASSVPGETTSIVHDDISVATQSSIQQSDSINLDLYSFVPTSALPDSSIGDSHSMVAGGTDMPHNDISQEFYQNMLAHVQELLQTSHKIDNSQNMSSDLTGKQYVYEQEESLVVAVPHILATAPEITLDESSHDADIITMKYIASKTQPENSTICDDTNYISIATDNYLQRHRLLPRQQKTTQVLDVGRLRTLPKLI